MGIVKQQSVRNTIIQYVGVVLGYFNSVILFTNILDTEQFGLTRIFFALATVYVNLSSLGTFKIHIRFFPHYQNREKAHGGLLTFNLLFSFIGFLIVTILYIFLKEPIKAYSNGTELFTQNYYYVILLSFVMLYANLLESFLMALKRTVLPHFLRNIFLRIVWMIEIGAYHFGWISFDTFIFLYVSAYFINFLIMLGILVRLGELPVSMSFFKKGRRVLKVVSNYGFFSIISGISSLLVNRIDIIMISFLLGLSSNSVYAIASYMSSVLQVPSQAIYRITMPVVAELWRKKDVAGILDLYRKSSINQFMFGAFIFLCIWMNIDDIFKLLPEQYASGKYVVLILGVNVMINLVTGINHVIIVVSRFYKYDTFASICLGLLTVLTNYLFIPIWGIKGAAFATLLSVLAYQSFKYILVYSKLGIQPLTKGTAKGLFVILGTYVVAYIIPDFSFHFLIRIAIKCMVISVVFVSLMWWSGVAEELRTEIEKYMKKFRIIR